MIDSVSKRYSMCVAQVAHENAQRHRQLSCHGVYEP
jgi:hypothetical protein